LCRRGCPYGIYRNLDIGIPISLITGNPAGPAGGERTTESDHDDRLLRRRTGLGWLIGGLIVFIVAAFAFAAVARLYFYPPVMPYSGGGFFFPFFIPFGFLIFLFIIFALSRLLFWPWAWGWRRGHWYHHDEAEEILRQRYAKGEITKEQFDQMRRDLVQRR